MAEPIPDEPGAITPAWLTSVLQPSWPGIAVVATEVLEAHSGTTGRLRLRLRHAPGTTGPDSVFVKLAPNDETQRRLVAVTDMGRREAHFYSAVATEVPLRVPEPYYAAHGDDPTEYVMVLEDLAAAGARFVTRLDPPGEEASGRLIAGLGRLHAHFWNDSRFEDELSWIRPAMRGAYGAKLIAQAREQFAADLPPVFAELCTLYVEHHEQICELWDDGESTLVHGDTHAGNQFVIGDEAGLYDWAVISRSPGIRDVSIFLGNSCPTELRRRHEQRWLGAYRAVLVDSGVSAPTAEDLLLRYRRCVLYAWVAATTTASMGSRWQPVEVGMEGMARATQTCADLDTLEAFRSSL